MTAPPRRILLASDAYPPLIGGADRAVQALAHELRDRGHAVAVLTAWQAGLPGRSDDDGVAVHRVRDLSSCVRFLGADPYKHQFAPLPDPLAAMTMRRIVRAFRPDVLHSYGWITYSCQLALAATGIPLVVSTRDYGNVCAVRTLLQRRERVCSGPGLAKCAACATEFYGAPKAAIAVGGVLGGRRRLARRIGGLHAASGYVGETMRRHLPVDPRTPSAVIPSFADGRPDEPPDPAVLARLPQRPFILFVGGLWRFKGALLLLEAHGMLRDAPPLVLIGTPSPELPAAAALPPDVTVLESVPHGTVMAAWERAAFGVFPSIWPEPFGNVVHEAMRRGRAVIGTTPGGHRDMIEPGVNGLLVPGGDRDALVAAMQRLIDEPQLRERMGRAGAAAAERFTAARAMPAFLDLYERGIRAAAAERAR